MKKLANIRIFSVFMIITIVFALISANVFVVAIGGFHINSGTNINNEVSGIHTVEAQVLAKRGQIIDRNGTILSQDVSAYTLYANIDPERFASDGEPAHVVDKKAAATIISSVIGTEYTSVLSTLERDDVKQVEFGNEGKYLTLSQKQSIESQNIPGVGFIEIVKRDYTSKSLASTLIGISVFDEEKESQYGIMGIEQYYDDVLKGENGYEVYQQDKYKYRFNEITELSKSATNGKNIVLTLDRGIQEELENALQQILDSKEVNAKEAWGGVMNIKTGEMLALADRPSFNANDPNTVYLNRGTQYVYEPGSTMKTFTIASAIDNNAVSADDTFDSSRFYLGLDDNGNGKRVSQDDRYIGIVNNADFEVYGRISYFLGYQYSSNVMIAELMTSKMNPQDYLDDLKELGFFEKVNADRVPDSEGQLLWNTAHEKITNGFGQGSTVNMLQIMQAYTAIFGDGSVIKPQFIKQIVNSDTNVVEYEAKRQVLNKVYKESTVQTVRDLMYENVDSVALTRFKMDEVKIMAKSGTAQLVIDGQYSKTQYINSAAIGFPYEDPQFMIYFAYQSGYHSTRITAGYIKNVVRKILASYPVDSGQGGFLPEGQVYPMENYINLPVTDARTSLSSSGIEPLVFGNGSTVINQYPLDGQNFIVGDKILLFTSTQNIEIPDMTGWSMKEVKAFGERAFITVNVSGNGYVKSQSIAKGTVLEPNSVLEIVLE